MIRNPVVAGQFYPGDAAQLREIISGYTDVNAEKEDVAGLLVPHAGYIYSGRVAGAPRISIFLLAAASRLVPWA